MIDTPKDLSIALQNTGSEVEVTKSLYDHYRNVFPLKVFGSNFFIFQEEDGERIYFSKWGNRYVGYLLSDYLVSDDWNIHTGVGRTDINKKFKVLFVFADDDTCNLPYSFDDFIDKEFISVSAIANAMNVSFCP